MGNIVKASDGPNQVKIVRQNRDVSDHRFFNAIAMAVKTKLEQQVPGLEVQFGGKTVSGSEVVAQLTGQMVDEDGSVDEKVRQTMDSLKNPSILLSNLE